MKGQSSNHSLLHRQRADVANEGPDERLRKPRVVQVENVLNDVVSERILDEVQRVEDDLSDELNALSRRGVVDGSLEDTTSVPVRGDLDQVGSDGVVDELVVVGNELVQAFLNDLFVSSVTASAGEDRLTWFPFKSLMSATTFMLKA